MSKNEELDRFFDEWLNGLRVEIGRHFYDIGIPRLLEIYPNPKIKDEATLKTRVKSLNRANFSKLQIEDLYAYLRSKGENCMYFPCDSEKSLELTFDVTSYTLDGVFEKILEMYEGDVSVIVKDLESLKQGENRNNKYKQIFFPTDSVFRDGVINLCFEQFSTFYKEQHALLSDSVMTISYDRFLETSSTSGETFLSFSRELTRYLSKISSNVFAQCVNNYDLTDDFLELFLDLLHPRSGHARSELNEGYVYKSKKRHSQKPWQLLCSYVYCCCVLWIMQHCKRTANIGTYLETETDIAHFISVVMSISVFRLNSRYLRSWHTTIPLFDVPSSRKNKKESKVSQPVKEEVVLSKWIEISLSMKSE